MLYSLDKAFELKVKRVNLFVVELEYLLKKHRVVRRLSSSF